MVSSCGKKTHPYWDMNMLAPKVGATILLCLASMEMYNWLISSSRRWGLLWIGCVFWPTLPGQRTSNSFCVTSILLRKTGSSKRNSRHRCVSLTRSEWHSLKSLKDDCLSKLILFGEASLRRALREYVAHYHVERNHQGKGNVLLYSTATKAMKCADGSVGCKERLGGLLKYYHQEAAWVFWTHGDSC